jgi:hypothetical protein
VADDCWTETIQRRTRRLDLPSGGNVLAAALNGIASERRTASENGNVDHVEVTAKDGSLYLSYEISREVVHDDGDGGQP